MALTIPIIFGILEIMLYSNSSWVVLYFSAWPLLILIILIFRSIIKKYWWIFIIITSLWGFCFGTLDSLLNLLLFGKASFYVYWIAGLPFDAVHGVANFMFSVFYTNQLWKYELVIYNTTLLLTIKLSWNQNQ